MNSDVLELLKEEVLLLKDSAAILRYSYESCRKIGIKDHYSLDELDRYEAFTSRFARTSDLLTQKIFRLIIEMDLENPGSVRDRIHTAEKKGIIPSGEKFVEIRVLRNDIAHEYTPESVQRIYQKVLEYAPDVLNAVDNVLSYCRKYL